eukprot:14643342-Alexandrium_andersonii.AAC.1
MLEGRPGVRRRRGALPEAVVLAAMEAPALAPCRALALAASSVPSEAGVGALELEPRGRPGRTLALATPEVARVRRRRGWPVARLLLDLPGADTAVPPG